MTLTQQPPAVDGGGQRSAIAGPGWAPTAPSPAWRPLDGLARWVMRCFVVQAALLVVVLIGELNMMAVLAAADDGTTTVARADFADWWGRVAFLLWVAALLVTAGVFLAWFRHAYRNLGALRAYGMQRSSGWAIGGWFVPFASLVIPKRMTDEMMRGSEPNDLVRNVNRSTGAAPGGRLVAVWWTLWIGPEVVIRPVSRLWDVGDDTGSQIAVAGLSALQSGLLLAALAAAALVVTRITDRQRVRAGLLGIEAAAPATSRPRRDALVPLAAAGLAGLVAAGGVAAASLRAGAGEPTVGEMAAERAAAHSAVDQDSATLTAVDQDSATLTAVDRACFDFGETMTALAEPQDLAGVAIYFEEAMRATAARDAAIAAAALVSPEEQSAFETRFRQPIEADTAVMQAVAVPVVEAARAGDIARARALLAQYPETQGTVEAAALYAAERDMQSCAAVFGRPSPAA